MEEKTTLENLIKELDDIINRIDAINNDLRSTLSR